MNTIDISTSQKVVINFETANARERITAFLIDMILLVIVLFIWVWILFELLNAPENWGTYMLVFIPITFYSLIAELLMNGQSPGKRAMALRVVNINGVEPSLNDYLIRWSFRLVEIWFTVGAVAVLLINAGGKGQRLGDMIANTTVIRLNNKVNVSLEQLENMRSSDGYEPVFEKAVYFSEEEMMLFKEVIDRSGRFRNQAHKEALEEAGARAASRIGLDRVPDDRSAFLRTLIRDYVAMSR